MICSSEKRFFTSNLLLVGIGLETGLLLKFGGTSIRQILDAYGEYLGTSFPDAGALVQYSTLKQDYLRQRERFYHAESLKNFARDTVPDGTFDALQDEIYHGVVDVCENNHANGFERMKATISQAASVAATSNPLVSSMKIQDRQGICHQLANGDRLKWVWGDD